MSSDQLIRHISINEALEIINKKEENNSLPVFEYEKGNIELKNGRYGFYLRFNEKNYKIDKEKYPDPKNISKNQAIEIRSFGRFSTKLIKANPNARNPRTNQIIYVPEKKKISFKMSKHLKEEINK